MIKQEILIDILKQKEIREIGSKDIELDLNKFKDFRIPEVTIHGRFQPPLHCNHFYTYVANAFQIAEKVIILITNPDLKEELVIESSHRSSKENNPFTYKERIRIFKSFFEKVGIPERRYEFRPFKITDDKAWASTLDSQIHNLVNVYGEWSQAKLDKFRDKGYKIIYSNISKIKNVSGNQIRKILSLNIGLNNKKERLIKEGYMEEAIQGLFEVIEK